MFFTTGTEQYFQIWETVDDLDLDFNLSVFATWLRDSFNDYMSTMP